METEMSCEQMLAEARRLAANVGYVVVPDVIHADGNVHMPDAVAAMAQAIRRFGFKVVPAETPAAIGSRPGVPQPEQAPIVTLEPGWDFNPVAHGLLALADALECFWNPAIDAARTSQDGTAIATAGALAEGFAAMARRLRESETEMVQKEEGR